MATAEINGIRGFAGIADARHTLRARISRSLRSLYKHWLDGRQSGADIDRRVQEAKFEAELLVRKYGFPLFF